LEIGTEVLKFAPIPGLDIAASLLLSIWDSVQAVDVRINIFFLSVPLI
jgi:hypothetical protein